MKSRLLPCAVLVLSLFVLTAVAVAQNTLFTATPRQLLDNAAGAKNTDGGDVVILLEDKTYDVDAENRVTFTLRRTFRVDTQRAVENWGAVSADWYPWYEDRPVIRARVITTDGVEHVLDAKALTEGPMNEDSPNVYEDGKAYRGPLPSVAVGSVVEEEIVMKEHAPMFAAGVARDIRVGSFAGPVEKTVITVRAPQTIPVKYVSRLLPNLSMEKKISGEMVEYRFEQGHMDILETADAGLPSDVPRSPYLYLSTGASWGAIASGYNAMIEAKLRTADVEALVKQTVKPGDSREDKIRKLLYLLHKKVRYTGVEFGEAALIPAYPAETLKRGYGDCKDKAAVLTVMLRSAGIPANLALLSAGDDEDIEPELPGMEFDHAIVHVPGSPELWIDATAENHRFGSLPDGDDGRLALIVDGSTDKLIRIPSAESNDNVTIEKREFVLAENGPATRVIETSLPTGGDEAWFRDSYANTEGKQSHDAWEQYVKDTYRAEKLVSVTHNDANDLGKPFELRVEAEKCRRGYTDDEKAEIAIVADSIYTDLPAYLKSQDKETKQDTKTEKPKKARTSDYVFTPFITEWQYHVIPPIGYRVRGLPENKTEAFGPAKLTYMYATEADGSITATLRFDTVKGRYTPEESEAIRTAIRQFEQRDAIMISFDNIGHALLAEGKVPEALKQYETVAAQHPKEALHRSQEARAFMEVGFCESARKEARLATELEPKSAKAFQDLAWILEHDMVCRRFKGDFDYNGAIAAYRKAIELDPSDVYTHVDLAILLEHGSDGMQYSATSHLDDAITELKKVREMDKEVAKKWNDNLLYDLMYGGHFEELKQELAGVSMNAEHRAMALVAAVELTSATAAIEESTRLTQDDSTRSSALADAAHILVRMRDYPEAAALMTVSAKGQENSAAAAQQADIYSRTKRIDKAPVPDTDPRSVIYKSLLYGMLGKREGDIVDLLSRSSLQGLSRQEAIDLAKKDPVVMKSGTPREVIADIALSSEKMSVEGDDVTGYHLAVQSIGSRTLSMFVVKEAGQYRLVGLVQPLPDLGPIVLEHLKNNNLEAARKILDWARADISIASGDDPLQGWAFPHLWTRGNPADPDKMRNAALSMAAARKDSKRWIGEIIAARDAAKSDNDRIYLEDSLTEAYVHSEDWKGVRESALRQLKVYPLSNSTLSILGVACGRLHDWDTWSQAIEARLAAVPDDPDVLREKARWFDMQSKFDESAVILKKLIDSGNATAFDRNEYAWDALVKHQVTQESIDQARQAVSLNKSAGIVQTLASLYAENGNSREAEHLLVEVMDDHGMDKPDSSLWYVFGRIAENYHQSDAAVACYKRVEWTEKFEPDPTATYSLAQKRLNGLQGTGNGVAEAK